MQTTSVILLSPRRQSLLATLLLIVLPFLLFWPVWWPDAGARQLFVAGDFVEQHVAMRTFVAAELRAGRLPLWDPYAFAGQPALTDSLLATFYPLGLWQALLPAPLPDWALPVEAIAHLSLGGLFTFLFVRRRTGHPGAALLSGIAFELGGWATAYPMLQIIILETAVWLPAALWWLDRALERRSWLGVAQTGLIFAVALLAGFPQVLMYAAYLTTAYFLFRVWQLRLGWRWLLGGLPLLGLVALGAAAAQWLPSVQMYVRSPRLGLSYAEVAHGFAVAEWWGILRPNLGEWSPLYVGLIPLLLAAFALLAVRRAEIAFWAAVAVVSLLLSVGGNGPLYALFHRVAPGFAIFRDQERIAFLWSMALVVLAGYGAAALLRRYRHIARLLPLLVALLVLDLFRANHGVILGPVPDGGYFPVTPLVAYLQRTGSPTWRTSSEGLLPGGPNAGMVFHLRDVVGSGPLYLAALDDFQQTVPELRWWQLLNVQHLLTTRQIEHGALLPVMEAGDATLYQLFVNGRDIWIAHESEVVSDPQAAMARTADPALDPMRTVVLEQPPDPLPQPASGSEQATVTLLEHQRLLSEVTLSAPAVVVWSEIAYPGWGVRANGVVQQPLRAYGLLRAVALPAGTWQIEWRFDPPLVRIGLLVSALTTGLILLLSLRERRRAVVRQA